jgi:hypothetical protein
MPGFSSAAKMFARNSNMAQRVAGGLNTAAGRVGRSGTSYNGSRPWHER